MKTAQEMVAFVATLMTEDNADKQTPLEATCWFIAYTEARGMLDAWSTKDVARAILAGEKIGGPYQTLDDVQQLLIGRQRRPAVASCRRVRDLLTRRIEDIDARIKELREFRRTLNEHLVACDRALAAAGDPECPTIEALGGAKRVSKTYEAR